MWSWGSGVILPWRSTPGRKSYGSFLPNSASLFFWNRWRKTSERVHFSLLVLARPGHEKSLLRPTKKGSGRQSEKDTPTEKSDSYFDQNSALTDAFYFVPSSRIFHTSLLNQVSTLFRWYVTFFSHIFISKALNMSLAFAHSLFDFQTILCSLIHALCSTTNLSE